MSCRRMRRIVDPVSPKSLRDIEPSGVGRPIVAGSDRELRGRCP
jgi:hypothetical protein